MNKFKEISVENFNKNPFKLIGTDWMLITAKDKSNKINTMTASWGGLGVMWGKDVCFIVIRPQRYTKEFIDSSKKFSLTFFDNSYKKILSFLGSTSGRDQDKISQANLTIMEDNDIPFFEEGNMSLFCDVLFHSSWDKSNFIDQTIIKKWYPESDFHTLYIGQINKILAKF